MARARNPETAVPPVNAMLESRDVRPDGPAVANDFVRRQAGLGPGALRLLGQALQERRGTAAEQAGDAERARLLSREINHRLDESAGPFSRLSSHDRS